MPKKIQHYTDIFFALNKPGWGYFGFGKEQAMAELLPF